LTAAERDAGRSGIAGIAEDEDEDEDEVGVATVCCAVELGPAAAVVSARSAIFSVICSGLIMIDGSMGKTNLYRALHPLAPKASAAMPLGWMEVSPVCATK
jgi:hypothetical protein